MENYIPPPQIPGIVYEAESNAQYALMLLAAAGLTYFVLEPGLLKLAVPALLAAAAFAKFMNFPPAPKSVHISANTVKADFGNGRAVTDTLDRYDLYIGRRMQKRYQAYTYAVMLKPRANARIAAKNLFGMNNFVPLQYRIFTPANLKQYIEAFQKQIEKPMELIFESDKIRNEYQQGKF